MFSRRIYMKIEFSYVTCIRTKREQRTMVKGQLGRVSFSQRHQSLNFPLLQTKHDTFLRFSVLGGLLSYYHGSLPASSFLRKREVDHA